MTATRIRAFISQSVLFSSLVQAMSLFKVSFMVGSRMAFFSGVNIMLPVLGAFGGLATTAVVLIVGSLVHGLFVGTSLSLAQYLFYSVHYLVYHIPGFCASAYWAHNHWSIRLALPLFCMLLFIAHPVGGMAIPYTFYWLIPVAIYCMGAKTIFAQALGSTFVAHAVGSVIWIYTVPMAVEQWYGLIPVVAVERLLFAAGMVVAYALVARIMAFNKSRHVQAGHHVLVRGVEK